MQNEDSSEEFLQIYNELDDFMRRHLGGDQYFDHAALLREMVKQNKIFSIYYKDLKMFSELRNLLTHNPYKKEADPLLMPHSYIVEKYKDIKNKIIHPIKAIDIAVRREFIYTTTLKGNALEIMKTMNDKTYTHVPVIEGDVMVGVFSENTLLSYLVHNKDSLIMGDTKIEEFRDFIPLEKHPSEFFEFLGRNALLIDAEDIFRKNLVKRKRVAVVFITETGRPKEKLLGMITAWDIAGK